MQTYCSTLLTRQVKAVLCDEVRRYRAQIDERFPDQLSALAVAAKELYQEAREELARRGEDADTVLSEEGLSPL